MVLATMIEAIFTAMGKPTDSVRQCPLAMDKWIKLVIGPRHIGLRLIIDTNRLTVTIPLNTWKKFILYLIPLGILTVVNSKYPERKNSRENWHILQKEPIGFSVYSPIYTLPSHTP